MGPKSYEHYLSGPVFNGVILIPFVILFKRGWFYSQKMRRVFIMEPLCVSITSTTAIIDPAILIVSFTLISLSWKPASNLSNRADDLVVNLPGIWSNPPWSKDMKRKRNIQRLYLRQYYMYTRSSIEDTAITQPGLYFVVGAFIAVNTAFNLSESTMVITVRLVESNSIPLVPLPPPATNCLSSPHIWNHKVWLPNSTFWVLLKHNCFLRTGKNLNSFFLTFFGFMLLLYLLPFIP